ncbi:site-2 protease family protein [Fluviispira sanaruensis]|uniref:Site-2 protease family protein n=1 Tax=Fluviispira sanaruensis TaxID=2493639 RepID=A0A4P2VGL0_FLUSA|nr:site-2 protease family protein [Fluviispira sanaruensis]BBH52023.1 site-2 protease family protein [Fluviispira sanaruensis]
MGSFSESTIAFGILKYLGFLIAIISSQAAIAIMARRRGDNSMQTSSMATLNPVPHIDPLGTVIFPIITILMNSPIVFGWPKRFNIDTRSFRNIKKDINIIYLSGIGMNFIIAIICMLLLRFSGMGVILPTNLLDFTKPELQIGLIVSLIGISNITIGALSLLPMPGLPGWNILINNLPYKSANTVSNNANMISIAGLLLIVFGALNFFFKFFFYLFILGTN